MKKDTSQKLMQRIRELENLLEESTELIEAIKKGEVDAFAINNDSKSEIYTLQSGDYAYRILIEEFPEGAINVTEDGLIVYTNPYFSELLQLSYEKVIGASVFDFIHPDSAAAFHRLFNESLTGKVKGEINLTVNGSVIPVYVSLTSLQPKLPTIGIIATDLSEKKKHEEQILAYQKDLEKKNQELISSNAELASFAYVASHDLQEPLRKIKTFASRIEEKENDNLSEMGKDHFRRMQNAAKRMQTLIEDLLAYSRTNTMERKLEHVSLKKMVEEVLVDLREEVQHKKAVIEITELCDVYVIPFQFRQLLTNLLSNALKFTKPDQSPVICISGETGDGSQFPNSNLLKNTKYCHISISDNGIGFEQQYSDRIFEIFQRLNGRSEYVGTGIGLAIVKKIVENHHGVITATAAVNQGALFDIYIPAN
ncbi:MAG TPA: ATP-binding protein [Chitinophagales bacterium]|nr:ATP-binding protein [Chitinophagales bacterium]